MLRSIFHTHLEGVFIFSPVTKLFQACFFSSLIVLRALALAVFSRMKFSVVGCVLKILSVFLRVLMAALHFSLNHGFLGLWDFGFERGIVLFAISNRVFVKHLMESVLSFFDGLKLFQQRLSNRAQLAFVSSHFLVFWCLLLVASVTIMGKWSLPHRSSTTFQVQSSRISGVLMDKSIAE